MRPDPPSVRERLELVLRWYQGMVSERTGRLVSTYEPERDRDIVGGSTLRDIASVWDMEILDRFLGRSDLRPVIERSLRHYAEGLVRHDGGLVLDPGRLGEPSGIGHSAFLLLALLDAEPPVDEATARAIAQGLLHQQRADGSYRVHFGPEPDHGLELYPGEAMLALMRADLVLGEARGLESVERGFAFYRRALPASSVAPDLLVFSANWQSQYAVLLHERTAGELRGQVRDHVFELHDRIVRSGFYRQIERHPERQATVEVACALEGLNDAYTVAVHEGDTRRAGQYAESAGIALEWLGRAQRIEDCTARERGGFGHSWSDRTQRIDVTGHVVAGFVKSARNGLVPLSGHVVSAA